MKLHELGRQILKIGYCEAIATYGLSYFKPLGIDTIMGRIAVAPIGLEVGVGRKPFHTTVGVKSASLSIKNENMSSLD